MKNLKITLVILLILMVALPLAARGRRSRAAKVSPLTLSVYGGAEDLTGEVVEDMYFSFGANAIFPVINPIRFRIGLANIAIHENSTVMSFGTGINVDIMYYFQAPMVFTPYGFGGLFYNSYSNGTSSSNLHLRIGLGAEMVSMYNFFGEFGLDFVQSSVGDVSNSYNPLFVHAGVRFPLFR